MTPRRGETAYYEQIPPGPPVRPPAHSAPPPVHAFWRLLAHERAHAEPRLSAPEIAARVSKRLGRRIAVRTLANLVRVHLDLPMMTLVRLWRVHDAKRLLLARPSDDVATIAEEVGFHEYRSFVRAFREVAGVSATDFRRQHLRPPPALTAPALAG